MTRCSAIPPKTNCTKWFVENSAVQYYVPQSDLFTTTSRIEKSRDLLFQNDLKFSGRNNSNCEHFRAHTSQHTMQRIATHPATHCKTLQDTATHIEHFRAHTSQHTMQHVATHLATHCNTQRACKSSHIATHTATRCNTRCKTLQHTMSI